MLMPGCATCKSKRLKCDETKPTCRQCEKRNVSCGGYQKEFKWRSYGKSSFPAKPASKGRKGGESEPEPLRKEKKIKERNSFSIMGLKHVYLL